MSAEPLVIPSTAFGLGGFLPSDLLDDDTVTLLSRLGAGSVTLTLTEAGLSHASAAALADTVQRLLQARIEPVISLAAGTEAFAAPAAWSETARGVATAVAGRVRHWTVGRVPDHGWPAQDATGAYVAFLRDVRMAIHSVQADAVIHAGEFGPGLPKSLQAFYDHGGRELAEAIDVQLRMNPLMPDAIGGLRYFYDEVRAALRRNGDGGKPVWVKGAGCPGVPSVDARKPWSLGKNTSEAVQSEWVRLHFQQVATWPGVERIFWSALKDRPGDTGDSACGFLRIDGSPKPSFATFQQLATLIK